MVKITLIESNGEVKSFDARIGQNLMEAATRNGIDGIIGECGGNCACGTCRFYPMPEWSDVLGPISQIEQDMLEDTEDSEPCVRLACRITVTDRLEGLIARLPTSQRSQ